MKKKQYICPTTEVIEICTERFIAASTIEGDGGGGGSANGGGSSGHAKQNTGIRPLWDEHGKMTDTDF